MAELPTRPQLPDEDRKAVTLREFEQRSSELKDQFGKALAHERELREEITSKLEDARKLNSDEILRRLNELNHAHSTAMENWARSLPRELFDQWKEDYDKWRTDVGTQLTIIAPHTSQINSLMARITALESEVGHMKSVGPHVVALDARLVIMERLTGRWTGALFLLGAMGVSGVLALILGLARLGGAIQ